ncbi:DUF1616 domain-containing protein [Natrarchaeobius oligotrophus]|uniref:DUF1616 domain-containing protein n=1 Tax=Natrarchaeobius chitinivorans TaxID=1679083 RepID=A0A3N6PKP3_NATCH|nr:DUF1616 domain-containing protein [Natrarchaeobius chitinivorans]RQG99365.1 DUF1616 domain-containing protein [Natrarchaeobius chitinivorans]
MSDSDWWFLDLAAVIAVTGTLSFALFAGISGPVRVLLAIPLVLFLPGYALVAVLYPDERGDEYRAFDDRKTGLSNPLLLTRGLRPIERLVLSVTFSVALVPAITLLTTLSPGGIVAESVLLGTATATIVLSVGAIASRYRCSPDRRYSPSLAATVPSFTRVRHGTYTVTEPRPYNVAIALAFVLLLASAGFALANPPQHDGFTEFAVETENVTGDVETMYPSTYAHGETRDLTVSITNREHESRAYTTVVLLERVDAGNGETTVENREELAREATTVADGTSQEQTLEITPTMRGDDLRLTLLLYEDEPPDSPTGDDAYRAMHLPIEVE